MGKQTKSSKPRGPGRPRVNAPDMTVRKAIRMTPEQEADWGGRAERDRRSFSDWARLVIEKACAEGLA